MSKYLISKSTYEEYENFILSDKFYVPNTTFIKGENKNYYTPRVKTNFEDFEMDLRNAEGNMILPQEVTEQANISFGFAYNNGVLKRTGINNANSLGTIIGKAGNNHGLQYFKAIIPVKGQVNIYMSTCGWGNNVTVKNSNGEVVNTFTTKKGENSTGCYGGGGKTDPNSVVAQYVGGATTLTIEGGGYVGFFAIENTEVQTVTVTYQNNEPPIAIGDILPTGGTYALGESYTIPENRTLYRESYILCSWEDEEKNEYTVGKTYNLSKNMVLQPKWLCHELTIHDRYENNVELLFNFRRDQGAPLVAWERTNDKILVTQALFNNGQGASHQIDVPIVINTTNGKFNNTGLPDWAQINAGTKLTIPSANGAIVTMEAFGTITTTTIDGSTDYTQGKTISYQVTSDSDTIDIVIGDGRYYRYVKVVLPANG